MSIKQLTRITALSSADLVPVFGASAQEDQAATLSTMADYLASIMPPGAVVNVRDYGAFGSGMADDTAAVKAAYDALAASGGGVLYFPAGVYLMTNSNPGAASWDNEVALWVKASNIHIRGAGRGATTLKLINGTGAHVIKFGQRADGTVTVSNCSVSDLSIDGNRLNIPTPNATDDHWQGIDVSTGCTNITLRDLTITQCAWYGIGFQRGGFQGCLVENVTITNTGSDCIDCKNDDSTGNSNAIRHVRGENMGLLGSVVIGTPAAGLDLRSGWSAYDCDMFSGASADNRAFRTQKDQSATDTDIPRFPQIFHSCRAYGTDQSGTMGFQINVRGNTVTDCTAWDFGRGFDLTRPDLQITNPFAYSNDVGICLRLSGTEEADTTTITGGMVRSSATTGLWLDSVDEITVQGLDIRQGGTGATGILIAAGSTAIRITGGSCTGHTTLLTDNGSQTIIRDVSGLRTENAVTVSAAIDSTGVKTLTIPHGLAVTPNLRDVSLTLVRNTNVSDWTWRFLDVTAADATNVTARLNVLTASATGGAVVDVVARIRAKAGV